MPTVNKVDNNNTKATFETYDNSKILRWKLLGNSIDIGVMIFLLLLAKLEICLVLFTTKPFPFKK